ncbi:MAG: DUF126 domain-containing protein [Nitrososphaerota archaeon]
MSHTKKKKISISCRIITGNSVKGEAIVSKKRISFYGSIDLEKGIVTEKDSDIYGKSIAGKILIFKGGKGSTVGAYAIMKLKSNNVAPKALICLKADEIITVGCVLSDITLVDSINREVLNFIKDGDIVEIDCEKELIHIERKD